MINRHRGTLADRVVTTRRSRDWTQAELAQAAAVSQQTIAKIESGHTRQPRNIGRIAGALGVSAAWLQFGVEELEQLDDRAIELALMAMEMTDSEREALLTYLRSRTED